MATYFLFGEPDWVGVLIYAVLIFGPIGCFVFVVRFIYVKVFRGGREPVLTLNPGGAGGNPDEQC